jgi:MFS superfamily sulfate permease-like transporter
LNYFFRQFYPDWSLSREHLVQLPVASNFGEFISFFKTPDFSAILNPDVYIVGITLAIVASIETLLCAEATDKLDPQKRNTPANKELKAQGIGNMISGLIGGLPITQVIVRSSANINAGATSKMSTIFHGIILLFSAILIPTLLNQIPLASLAAILLLVGYKLSRISLYKTMYKLGWDQFMPFLATVVGILTTDLLMGIGIGMVFAFFFILRTNFRRTYHLKNELSGHQQIIRMRLAEEVTFLNKASIQQSLLQVPANAKLIIDGSQSVEINYDVLEMIQDFKQHRAPLKGIDVETIGIREVALSGH